MVEGNEEYKKQVDQDGEKTIHAIPNKAPIQVGAFHILEVVEEQGIKRTLVLLQRNDGRLRDKELVMLATEIKKRLELAAEKLQRRTHIDIRVRFARIMPYLYRELDFDKVLHFASVVGDGIDKMPSQLDYTRYTQMATDLMRKGAEYYKDKHFSDLDLTDCVRTEQLICVADQAWNAKWVRIKEYYARISRYRSKQLSKYYQNWSQNPVEKQWCFLAFKRLANYKNKIILPENYDKKFFDKEIIPRIEEVQKNRSGVRTFLKYFQYCHKTNLHVGYILTEICFDCNPLEMYHTVNDTAMCMEYRLYTLFLFAQIRNVKPEELYEITITQAERDSIKRKTFNDFMKQGPTREGFDAFFEEDKKLKSQYTNTPFFKDLDMHELRRISLTMLQTDYDKHAIRIENPIFDVYTIQTMMVAIAILASQMTSDIGEEIDPMRLIYILSEGVIYRDAYVQIADRSYQTKPHAVISLESPKKFIKDVVNLMFKETQSSETIDEITSKIIRLIEEGVVL